MNQLMNLSEQQTKMSSNEIAQITGKLHKNVLADCDNLNANYLKLNMAEISAMENDHPTVPGRKIRQFLLTKMQTMDLMTGYNTELRIKVNRRWEELESNQKIDLTNAEHVLAIAQQYAIEQKKRIELEGRIEEQRPKVRYAEAVAASDDMVLVREWCKQISSEAGITIGQNRAFKWLRVNKYLNSKNEPYQKWIDAKIFHVKSANINTVDHSFNKPTTMITGKGRIYLSKRLFDEFTNESTQNKLNF